MLIEFPSTKSQGDETGRRPLADLISVPEAARRIGLHADTLYRLCRAGRFSPAIQIGSRWRVSLPKLERYLHGEDLSG
jgi:excisionase family DNA binding protein